MRPVLLAGNAQKRGCEHVRNEEDREQDIVLVSMEAEVFFKACGFGIAQVRF